MGYLLGIDIGTSSAKALLLDSTNTKTIATRNHEYPVYHPKPGYAEQNPADWWHAVIQTVRGLMAQTGIAPQDVHAIGLSGQMHGAVLLDAQHQPVQPAIIWADARSKTQVDRLTLIAADHLAQYAPGPPAAGFMGPSLMWLAEHQPNLLARTHKVLFPKDYIRLQLTGTLGTDPSDAAASWLFDIRSSQWSPTLATWCGIDTALLPPIDASGDVVGTLTTQAAEVLGLAAGTPVVAGCADQCAQALGYGLIEPGVTLATIGTGGQVFMTLNQPYTDPQMRFYTFNHALPQHWYAAAAILTAGVSLRWLRDLLGLRDHPDAYAHLSELAASVPPGAEGLVFLPHLAGERTPHMDPLASGVFVGLRLHHQAGHMARAVMEGVTAALRECLALVNSQHSDTTAPRLIITGGAANSAVWRQIQADIYGQPVTLAAGENHACIGAALLAGAGCGVYASLSEALENLPKPTRTIAPDPQRTAFYAERQYHYGTVYQQLRTTMHTLATESAHSEISG